MGGVDKHDWSASKSTKKLRLRLLDMEVKNAHIIYNWANDERETQAQKRICFYLEEQLADSTLKTLHLGNSKSKDTIFQGFDKFQIISISIFKDI